MSNQAASNGVVFIEPWHATIARSGAHGPVVASLRRRHETRGQFLGRVAHEVQACQRLAVLGSGPDRLAFEREYVQLTHRPDVLVRDERAIEPEAADLISTLNAIAA
jgi:hypothetical protein